MLQKLPKAKVQGVFTDLDDTLTNKGGILPETFQCLWGLKEKNYWLVIVSGRPAGWADCLMRLWPIDAIVFENGAGIMTRDGSKLKTICLAKEKNLTQQRKVLQTTFAQLKKKVKHLKLATDQPFRLFDYAIDHAEEPPLLSETEINYVMKELGKKKSITAKLSSIHINYWYGQHTKITAVEHLLATEGKARGITKDEIVFCGDSPNDEPMFEAFPLSVGVANVLPYLNRLKSPPRYFTRSMGGRGFQELAAHLGAPVR